MEMEAHQKLDPPVRADCCTQIQLAIRNTDQYPGTVSLELILIDTSVAINLVQSLGTASAGFPSPAEQVLSFAVPKVTALRSFAEIKVVFHRAQLRGQKRQDSDRAIRARAVAPGLHRSGKLVPARYAQSFRRAQPGE
jgi:hypothetical protein